MWTIFISTHGARKGLADTALKTADAGYLTLAHFDRILELGEQTRPLQEFFKNFLKTVPIYPRFFSY